MSIITGILGRGSRNYRVRDDNGLTYLVPKELAVVGNELPEIKRSSRTESLDFQEELKNIRRCIKAWHEKYRCSPPPGYSIEDLVQETFVSFWERDVWSWFDPARSSNYMNFLFFHVRNFIVSFSKNTYSKAGRLEVARIGQRGEEDEDSGWQGGVVDPEDVSSSAFANDIVDSIANVIFLDSCSEKIREGEAGVSGLSFSLSDLFDSMRKGDHIDDMAERYGYSPQTIRIRQKQILSFIKKMAV